MSILQVSDITKSFGGLSVLDGLNMEIQKGKIYQLIGPNGSGKTTLINIISGMLKPDSGSIIFDGKDITNKSPYQTYQSGLVRTWQIPKPFVKLNVMENLLMCGKNAGESFIFAPFRLKWKNDEEKIMDKAIQVMEMTSLSEKKNTLSQNLSGGQQKLLELGRVMMSGAKMILMDEPIAGVNPTLAHEIFEKIVQICKKQSITFLIIEHRLDISLQYADSVFALNTGKIIAQGSSKEIIKHPKVIESYLGG